MTYSYAQHIIAAFCYVTAAMVWVIGDKMVYLGSVPLWFVGLITALIAMSGLSFNLNGVDIKGDTK